MYSFLLLALLLTLILEPAVATSPVLDPTLPAAPMAHFYADPEGILAAVCELCSITLEFCTCTHALVGAIRPASAAMLTRPQAPPVRQPTFTPSTFLDHPEWSRVMGDSLPVLDASPEPEFELQPDGYFADTYNQPLSMPYLHQFNENATTVQPSTVQEFVEDIYTPGDRLLSGDAGRGPHRRQAPRPGGFPCDAVNCAKKFNRSCDLKRHQKTHQPRAERPHKCSICSEGFLYPKDRNRHQRTHEASAPKNILYCEEPDCTNIDGFSRRDNLLRHRRKQHPHLCPS
ncbi:hypothetical protein P154DRAFT_243169 [Amniculicola lignicola CBS 123094]|uniref:C2H2-type domain-containing protein n=1 Tax=Amniculicola lignicola CBS 123094 TaxID=1392246 RepID=A0A6A5WC64_9PLEO|nr:hypothetical protein P154DRAFT_243169 [Amniculicola lignicola CBS 123094]